MYIATFLSTASSPLRIDGPCSASSGEWTTNDTWFARRSSASSCGRLASVASTLLCATSLPAFAASGPNAIASEPSAANIHASSPSPTRCRSVGACSTPVSPRWAACTVSVPTFSSTMSSFSLLLSSPGTVVGTIFFTASTPALIIASAALVSPSPSRSCSAAGSLEPANSSSPLHPFVTASKGGGTMASCGCFFSSTMSVRAHTKPAPGCTKRSIVDGPGSSPASTSFMSLFPAAMPMCTTPAPAGVVAPMCIPPLSGE